MGDPSQLPPLNAVRCFEAAARCGSFTAAAQELGMTQAAVSYQIRVLEDRTGAALFRRKPRGVELTEVGQRFASSVSDAFSRLRQGFAEARQSFDNTLDISSLPSFAISVLAPRIGRFQINHPCVSLRLDTDKHEVDLDGAGVPTIALRSARQIEDDRLQAHPLMRFNFSPMLGAETARHLGAVDHPRDLLALPRIEGYESLWARWFAAAGVEAELPAKPHDMERFYEMQVMSARAAMSGSKAAMLTPSFFQEELASGALVQPFALECDIGLSIWMVYAKRYRRAPALRAFRDWFLADLAEDNPLMRPVPHP